MDLDVGDGGYADYESFIVKAELSRARLQSLGALTLLAGDRASKVNPPARPFFAGEMWQPPADWRPMAGGRGWPKTGVVPRITLPQQMLAGI